MTRAKDKGAGQSESFASRWSRRKKEAGAAPEPETAPAPSAEALDDRPDEEILEELGLPDPDSLGPGDDFKAFMSKAVPARLRHRALRRLWVSDPVFANLDNLVDYAEDFTYGASAVGALATAYQVGKGFADSLPAAKSDGCDVHEGAEAEADEEDAGTETASEPAVANSPAPGLPEAAEPPDPGGDETVAEACSDRESGAPERPRKRMRFRLVED